MAQLNKTFFTDTESKSHAQSAEVVRPKSNFETPTPTSVDEDFPAFVNTLAETARGLKMSEKSVRRLIDRGLLSASKGLRHIRITRRAISDYLANTSK